MESHRLLRRVARRVEPNGTGDTGEVGQSDLRANGVARFRAGERGRAARLRHTGDGLKDRRSRVVRVGAARVGLHAGEGGRVFGEEPVPLWQEVDRQPDAGRVHALGARGAREVDELLVQETIPAHEGSVHTPIPELSGQRRARVVDAGVVHDIRVQRPDRVHQGREVDLRGGRAEPAGHGSTVRADPRLEPVRQPRAIRRRVVDHDRPAEQEPFDRAIGGICALLKVGGHSAKHVVVAPGRKLFARRYGRDHHHVVRAVHGRRRDGASGIHMAYDTEHGWIGHQGGGGARRHKRITHVVGGDRDHFERQIAEARGGVVADDGRLSASSHALAVRDRARRHRPGDPELDGDERIRARGGHGYDR
jgi:hypothetical protein